MFACLALSKRLELEGHKVYMLAPDSESSAELVRAEGTAFLPLVEEPIQISGGGAGISKLKSRLKRYLMPAIERKQKTLALKQGLKGYEQLIDRYQPSLIICDMECSEYVLCSLSRRLNILTISHFLPVPAWPDIPIPNSDMRVSNRSKSAIILDWLWGRSALYLQNLSLRIRKQGRDKKTVLLHYAQMIGIGKRMIWGSTYLPGPVLLFKQVPLLHIMPKGFDYDHRLRDNESYVGPLILESKASDDPQLIESVARAIDHKHQRKVIVCAMSSLATVDAAFIGLLISAIGERKDWMALIGLGGQSEYNTRESLPSNITVYPWLPVTFALSHADCAVITAGYNTINECIYYGVPMLAFSLNTTDQNGCVARIVDHKLGLKASFDSCTKQSLQQDITRLTEDQDMNHALQQMQLHAKSYQENQVIEKVVSKSLIIDN